MKVLPIPHTLVLIFSIIVLMGALTWVVPAGEFARAEKQGRTVVVPGTYQRTTPQQQDLADMLAAPIRGFVEAANIIAFIFIAGGAFGVVAATGAINSAIAASTRALERRPSLRLLIIPLLTTLFSLAGATFGMSEEVLVFVLIFIPFALALGYDSLVGVAIPFVGAGAGFAAAFLNPFTVGIAQGIAELPLFSGWPFRLAVWAVVTLLTVIFIMHYAAKVKRDPRTSPVYELDRRRRQEQMGEAPAPLGGRQKSVLAVFVLALLGLMLGALEFNWYITEIGALFLAMGILSGLVAGMSLNQTAEAFIAGAREMMTAALVVAFSRGILVIATDGKIIDTILNALAGLTAPSHPVLAGYLMLAVQAGINFFVPSGSGQAALTMPIMAPLSDLLGLTRQTAVLIFQLGDGFNNLIIPTSGVTMGMLGIAKIPFEKWVRWILPLEGLFFAVGMIFIALAVMLQWGPH
ncbi:MAG: TIGR00366 family protein [candidate division KSB1 bacterium]|nr:TIGR00366 family protein [candidate division KSB1 bacterium]MDZ7274640.1 TIGR00366 family protein [candidate division KSB1 bacterium]MDZ7285465.1 TIGR00366 family protein [candidate division KSB1 bacterium]MDZ7298497.1 TIGR00366 family protein [candidate division KSB1 bacterium]MDZ7306279.1 TIGR00366 family protein [candidate division KSB1 bacterium]